MAEHIPEGEFVKPDFGAPLDVEAAVAATPEDATTKGMYLSSMVQEVERRGRTLPGEHRYVAFKDYPTRDYLRLCVEAAAALFPDQPQREGLRRIGWTSYTTFTESLVGKVVMGVLGRNIVRVTQAVGKAYQLSGKPGDAEVLEVDEVHSLVRLTEVYAFIDCLQVGVFEGAFDALGYRHEVRIKLDGPASAWFRSDFERLS